MKRLVKTLLALALAFGMLCAYHSPADAKVRVHMNYSSRTLVTGKTVSLKVNGTKRKAKWYSSNKKIATVSSKGKITAKKKGKCTITAKIGKKKYRCKITVKNPTVILDTSDFTLMTGDFKTVTASTNGTGKKTYWYSSNKNVAEVYHGDVYAVGTGKAKITAKISGISKSVYVTVTDPEVTSLSLNRKSLCMDEGTEYSLEATIYPEFVNDDISWYSDDPEIAEVDDGNVKAVHEGITNVYAVATNGKKAECSVNVSAPEEDDTDEVEVIDVPIKEDTSDEDNETTESPVTDDEQDEIKTEETVEQDIPITSIELSENSITLNKCESEILTADISPYDTTLTKDITWSSADETVAAVDDGKVTATGKGTTVITAETVNGVRAECTVTVKVPVTSMKLSTDTLNLCREDNDEKKLTLSIEPDDYTDKITWRISDEDVAEIEVIDDTHITVRAVGHGEAKITARASSGVTVSCKVCVTDYSYDIEILNKFNIYGGHAGLGAIVYIRTDNPASDFELWDEDDQEACLLNNTYSDVDYLSTDGYYKKVDGGYITTVNMYYYYGSHTFTVREKTDDDYIGYDSIVITGKDYDRAKDTWFSNTLEKVTDDTMTDLEKIYALRDYIRNSFRYSRYDEDGVIMNLTDNHGAYFETEECDCMCSTNIIREFADRLGIENTSYIYSGTQHYVAVVIIDGEQYFIDAQPQNN